MAPASIPVVVNLGEITNNTLHGSIEILLNHTLWKQLLASHPGSNTSLLVNTKQSQSSMDLQNTEGDNIPPYDGRGAGMYACLVIAFYAFSIIMFIATIVKRKVEPIDSDEGSTNVDHHLALMRRLKQETEREHYRKLKTSIIRVVTQGELSRASSLKANPGQSARDYLRPPPSRIHGRRASELATGILVGRPVRMSGLSTSLSSTALEESSNSECNTRNNSPEPQPRRHLLLPPGGNSGTSLEPSCGSSCAPASDEGGSISSDQGIVLYVDESGVTVPGITIQQDEGVHLQGNSLCNSLKDNPLSTEPVDGNPRHSSPSIQLQSSPSNSDKQVRFNFNGATQNADQIEEQTNTRPPPEVDRSVIL